MQLRVDRIESDNESTLGRLYIDHRFQCWTLEDQYRAGPKVKGETRIPAGVYQLKLRTEGGFHAQYTETYRTKFGPDWHKGMLNVTDVPGFEFILIHVGNSHDDTQGCLLVGQGKTKVDGFHYVSGSRPAYEALYPKVRDALLAGEPVEIAYVDLDPAARPAPAAMEDATLVVLGETGRGPAAAAASVAPAAGSAASPAGSGHSGVVAGTAAAAGAAVVAVGAAEVAGGDGVAGDLMSRIADPDNVLKIVLVGLGVVVVLCAIYFIVRRVSARKAQGA